MPCFAGAPAPPPSEAGLLEYVQKLKATEDEVMPGDNVPRRLRLAGGLYALAKFYNDKNSYEKADQFYGEAFAMLSADKSDWGLSSYRMYSNSAALVYMERGNLVKAKEFIDIAVKICREHPKENDLPGVLTTLAKWQKQMKHPKEAETTLLEAMGLMGEHGSGQQVELAKIYLETDQLAKADKMIAELEKSTYMSYAASSVMLLRAKWFRASGKISEADEHDTKARALEIKEREHRENCQ